MFLRTLRGRRCGASLPSHLAAGPHRDETVLSRNSSDPHREAVRVRRFTIIPFFGIRFQRPRHSFRPPGKSVGQERAAARSFRPEIWRPSADGMKLARCARSDSHSVRALRAVKSHPCGAGLHSNGRGAAPVLNLRRAFFQCISPVLSFIFQAVRGQAH